MSMFEFIIKGHMIAAIVKNDKRAMAEWEKYFPETYASVVRAYG